MRYILVSIGLFLFGATSAVASHNGKIHFVSAEPFTISSINYNDEQRQCLALNIYHESRGQSIDGQIAVGLVTLNRVASNKYPNDICSVVKQAKIRNGNLVRGKCQFSWWCDGRSDKPKESTAWQSSVELASIILDEYVHTDYDTTNGALWYHASYVNPKWASRLAHTVVIDDHLFYTTNP